MFGPRFLQLMQKGMIHGQLNALLHMYVAARRYTMIGGDFVGCHGRQHVNG